MRPMLILSQCRPSKEGSDEEIEKKNNNIFQKYKFTLFKNKAIFSSNFLNN